MFSVLKHVASLRRRLLVWPLAAGILCGVALAGGCKGIMGDGVTDSGNPTDGDTSAGDGDADHDVVVDADRDAVSDSDLDPTQDSDLDEEVDRDEAGMDAEADLDLAADADEEVLGPCPADMVETDSCCMDRYEAPNRSSELPLVMYNFVEAADWCAARGRRLCFDDEWQDACEGPAELRYPYGDEHVPGLCNDDELWRVYSQTLLNGWPGAAAHAEIETLDELFATAAEASTSGAAAAEHVESLYQGEPAGANPECRGVVEVFDLVGNVEEWTRRRDGGERDFHGALKGRYWAESRTCQSSVTTHGDSFRFYEIGFRCCLDLL